MKEPAWFNCPSGAGVFVMFTTMLKRAWYRLTAPTAIEVLRGREQAINKDFVEYRRLQEREQAINKDFVEYRRRLQETRSRLVHDYPGYPEMEAEAEPPRVPKQFKTIRK